MIKTRKVLPIFLASPGDLSPERQHANACVDEWNSIHQERTGWTVDLMGWEDTLPQTGRPQEIINTDVRRCAIFVGMMWKKWGSTTGNKVPLVFGEDGQHLKHHAVGFRDVGRADFYVSFQKSRYEGDRPGEAI